MTTNAEPRTYGPFWRPSTSGWGKLNQSTSLTLGFLAAATVLGFITTDSFVWLGIGAAITLLFWTVASVPSNSGVSAWASVASFFRHQWSKVKGTNTYRTGVTGNPTLPGLLAGSRVTEHADGLGGTFAVIHHSNGQVALPLITEPTGGELHDAETIDQMVANWGGLGAMLANSPGVSQYTTTSEVGPNYGATALQEVHDQMDPDAPELARQINAETTALSSESRTTSTVTVTVTFNGFRAMGKGKTRDEHDEEIASDLASRLPLLIGYIQEAGGGAARPTTRIELAQMIRTAYDPDIAQLLDALRRDGLDPDMEWDQVGPTAHDSERSYYRHDSGTSVTLKMTNAPQALLATALNPLTVGHKNIHRKRVTVIHRVIDSTKANKVVENAFAHTSVKTRKDRVEASASNENQIADSIRNEVVTGAAVQDFTILITATVLDPEQREAAVMAVKRQLAPNARMGFRVVYDNQDTAFAAALPLGLDVKAHNKKNQATSWFTSL